MSTLEIKLDLNPKGVKDGVFKSSRSMKKLQSDVAKSQKGFRNFQSRVRSNFARINDSIKRTSTRINNFVDANKVALAGATIAFGGIALGFKKMVSEAAKFETIETGFKTMIGDADKAKEHFNDLVQFTAKTPFQMDQVAAASKVLLGFGMNVEEVIPRLQNLGDISSATGKPIKDLAVLFGQVSAAGKLTGERLNQLQEASVPIASALAKVMKVSENSIKSLVSQGKVSAQTFRDAMDTISAEGGLAFNAMIAQSKTMSGLFSTLRDNISILAAKLGGKFLPTVKATTLTMIEFFGAIINNKYIIDLAASFGKLIAILGGVFAAAVGLIAVWKVLIFALSGVIPIIGSILLLAGFSVPIIKQYKKWKKETKSTYEDLIKGTENFYNKMVKTFKDYGKEFEEERQDQLKKQADADEKNKGKSREQIAFEQAIYDNKLKLIGELINKEIELRLKKGKDLTQKEADQIKARYELLSLTELQALVDKDKEIEKQKADADKKAKKDRDDAQKQKDDDIKKAAEEEKELQKKLIQDRTKMIEEAAFNEAEKLKSQGEEINVEKMNQLTEKYNELTDHELFLMNERHKKKQDLANELRQIEADEDQLQREEKLLNEIDLAEGEEAEKLKQQSSTYKTLEKERRKEEIANQKQEMKDRVLYSKELAKLMKGIRSKQFNAMRDFTHSYASLVNSENKKLKAIGKVASIADIVLNSARNFFAIFSKVNAAFPFLAPAIGAAAAAPIPIMAKEQISKVRAAQEGGIVERAFNTPPVGDFQRFNLEPGEQIIPKQETKMLQEFLKKVNSPTEDDGFFNRNEQNLNLDINMTDDASSLLEINQRENQALGTGVTR